jgi:hypothetical protein
MRARVYLDTPKRAGRCRQGPLFYDRAAADVILPNPQQKIVNFLGREEIRSSSFYGKSRLIRVQMDHCFVSDI